MNARTLAILLASVSLAALAAAGGWYHAHQALRESRVRFCTDTLHPMASLLKENQAIMRELQAEPFKEQDDGILESYLAKVRRDGVAKHADMKQRLDTLAENNAALVTLIKAYSSEAVTPAFTSEADKFRNYAAAWRDRWNSVMELFMAGGNYPASGIPFPSAFPEAVQAEITAVR